MSTNLVADEQNELHKQRHSGKPAQPAALRIPATIISYIFHPLFVPVYIVAFLVYIQPYLYAGFSTWDKQVVVLQAFMMYTFFPLVSVLLLKAVKFIDSVFLKTQRDRIIPYIVCGVYYFWAWYVRHNLPETPPELVYFSLAIFIASSIGLIANIYMKVSMHAISMGVVAAFIMLMSFSQDISFTVYISVAILIAGLVSTSRFIVSDHTPQEVYVGLFIGVVSQLFGYWFA